tara:strand:+ start:6698 stop:7048 length:351 start_codon:yes stop_codon:yes gene_type:complete
MQLELFTNSWGIHSGYQHLVEQLNDRLPFQGKVDKPKSTNKQLEKFRVAQNLLHDLFNNALGNKRAHFQSFFGFVPINTSRYGSSVSAERWNQVENEMSEHMIKIIFDAASEQGIK